MVKIRLASSLEFILQYHFTINDGQDEESSCYYSANSSVFIPVNKKYPKKTVTGDG